jgi:hypothetical protein
MADYLAGEEFVDVGEILTPLRITKLPPLLLRMGGA